MRVCACPHTSECGGKRAASAVVPWGSLDWSLPVRLGEQASGPACFCQHFKRKCVTPHLGPLNVGSGDQSQVLTLVWPTLTHWDVFLAPTLAEYSR